MLCPRPWTSAIAVLTVAAATATAAAQPAVFGTAELAGGGGHDSNVFLQASPDAGSQESAIEAFYMRVAPGLEGALAISDWRLEGSYALDYRASREAGNLLFHQLGMALVLPHLGPVQPKIRLELGRFDAVRFADEDFRFAAGAVDLRLLLTDSLRATAAYRAELRQYPRSSGPGALRLVQTGELRVAYRTPSLELGVGGSYLGAQPARAGVVDDGLVRLVRLGPDAELVWGRLTIVLGAWGGLLEVAGGERRWQLGGVAAAIVELSRNLEVTATAEWSASPSRDDLTRNYARRFVGLALVAHVTGKRVFTRERPAPLRPIAHAGKVRFRARAERASMVEVIGSWNGWAQGAALQPSAEAGVWEAWLPLPAGSHRYRLLVDGRVARPPDASRYISDDFGGEDAVLDVPGPRMESP